MPKIRRDIKDLKAYNQVRTVAEKYPWLEALMDGQTHELTKGKDFVVTTETMRASCLNWAKRHGHKVIVRVEKGNVLIQASVKPKVSSAKAKRR